MHVKHLVHLSGPYFMKSEMVWPLGKGCVCVCTYACEYIYEGSREKLEFLCNSISVWVFTFIYVALDKSLSLAEPQFPHFMECDFN